MQIQTFEPDKYNTLHSYEMGEILANQSISFFSSMASKPINIRWIRTSSPQY